MKLKQMLLWQYKASRSAFLTFYLIVAAVTIAGSILFAFNTQIADSGVSVVGVTINSDSPTMGNFNMATLPIAVIFLFIFGLANFGENIRVALANGVSRRTHYISFLSFSLISAVVTALLSILFDAIPYFFGTSGASSQFSGSFIERTLFFTTLYLFVIALGYFIAGAYYRMNNPARVIVSIGVPAGLIYFAVNVTNARSVLTAQPMSWEAIAAFFERFGQWMTQTLNASLFFAIIAALFLFLGWLVTRRAPIKAPAV
ncbi:MAG: hypothetical protein VB081_07395 [Christensenella sp.]|uniref:hypothetical protein n=1 Tax=Christensenella sp. TaxID=1935934 RepID=UPI002B1FB112|nr:hypothetical protein [Christensenella sp.]MEA5003309.1 hypothetical protein [Christensenella sp.]